MFTTRKVVRMKMMSKKEVKRGLTNDTRATSQDWTRTNTVLKSVVLVSGLLLCPYDTEAMFSWMIHL
jgi:hypothetical protein